ncbi:MAG: hypothetical protein AAB650_02490 [Patescibacteria group bacterium]
MADVVVFETDQSVSEVLDDVLSYCGIEHRTFCFPIGKRGLARVEYFREILAEHQPKIVLMSYRHIWPVVLEAVLGVQPRPQLWVFTGYNAEMLNRQGVFFRADRVFEKPYHVYKLGRELQRELNLPERVSP